MTATATKDAKPATKDYVALFQAQLRDGDLSRAQRYLDLAGETVPDAQWRYLAAELELARKRHDEVLALMAPLRELPGQRLRATNTAARALISRGDGAAALEMLAEVEGREETARLRVDAALVQRDWARAAELAEEALAAFPENGMIQQRAMTAYARAGHDEKATDALLANTVPQQAFAAMRALAVALLIAQRIDLLEKYRPLAARYNVNFMAIVKTAIRNLYDPAQTPSAGVLEDREAFKATVRRLSRISQTPQTALDLARAFDFNNEHEEADHYIARYREERRRKPFDPSGTRTWPRNIEAGRLDALAEWLQIPEDERQAWKAKVQHMEGMPNFLTETTAITLDQLKEQSRQIRFRPLTPIVEHQSRGEGCFMVSTHLGVLLGMWGYFWQAEEQGCDIRVFGLTEVSRKLLPMGHNIMPRTTEQHTRVRLARQMVEVITSGKVAYISGDYLPGARTLIHQNGCAIRMPDSVPRISQKYGAPSYFVCTYFEGDGMTSCCWPLPVAEPGEAPDAFAHRWALGMLEHMRKIALTDPRNVAPFGAIRKLRPGEEGEP